MVTKLSIAVTDEITAHKPLFPCFLTGVRTPSFLQQTDFGRGRETFRFFEKCRRNFIIANLFSNNNDNYNNSNSNLVSKNNLPTKDSGPEHL
jgi:hypothetical protein